MEKINFLNLIEGYYGFQLTKPQLQYFFTGNRYVAMSSPRRGGKSFITNMDSLYACTIPNTKVAIILPYEHGIKLAKDEIIDMANALNGYLHIHGNHYKSIHFSNGSIIYFFTGKSFDNDSRGHKLDKITIEEPDYMDNIELIKLRAEACMCINENAQFKMVGTHGTSKHNLAAYLLNPYFESITATLNSTHLNYDREKLNEFEQDLPEELYSLEILNQITPSILNRHLINNE